MRRSKPRIAGKGKWAQEYVFTKFSVRKFSTGSKNRYDALRAYFEKKFDQFAKENPDGKIAYVVVEYQKSSSTGSLKKAKWEDAAFSSESGRPNRYTRDDMASRLGDGEAFDKDHAYRRRFTNIAIYLYTAPGGRFMSHEIKQGRFVETGRFAPGNKGNPKQARNKRTGRFMKARKRSKRRVRK